MSVEALAPLAKDAQDEAKRILDRAARRLLGERLAEPEPEDQTGNSSAP